MVQHNLRASLQSWELLFVACCHFVSPRIFAQTLPSKLATGSVVHCPVTALHATWLGQKSGAYYYHACHPMRTKKPHPRAQDIYLERRCFIPPPFAATVPFPFSRTFSLIWGGPLNLCDELPANTFPPASKGILDLLGVPSPEINSFR
jgi:hypothetical protein